MQEQFPAAQPQSELAPNQLDGSNGQPQALTPELPAQPASLHSAEDINQLLAEPAPVDAIDQPIAATSEPTAEKEVKTSFMAKVRGALAKLASKKTVAKAAAVVAAPVAVVAGSQSIDAVAPEAPAPIVASVESDPSSSFLGATEAPTTTQLTPADTFNTPQGGGAPTEYTPPAGNVYLPPVTPEQPPTTPEQPPIIDTPSSLLEGLGSSENSNFTNEISDNLDTDNSTYGSPAESKANSPVTEYDANAKYLNVEKSLQTDAAIDETTIR